MYCFTFFLTWFLFVRLNLILKISCNYSDRNVHHNSHHNFRLWFGSMRKRCHNIFKATCACLRFRRRLCCANMEQMHKIYREKRHEKCKCLLFVQVKVELIQLSFLNQALPLCDKLWCPSSKGSNLVHKDFFS